MDTSWFMNYELSSIVRECKYYSITSFCEALHRNAASNVEKIEKYLLEEQNCFYLGSDFEYFSKLAKSAGIAASSDDGNHLWISIEVLLHIITYLKKGKKGRRNTCLLGKWQLSFELPFWRVLQFRRSQQVPTLLEINFFLNNCLKPTLQQGSRLKKFNLMPAVFLKMVSLP